ncbi:MAG: hypothetical protein JXD23_03470 [Spirochaetales bacterium]|nr:hypothetical protein [Spirochaetales bacterium]
MAGLAHFSIGFAAKHVAPKVPLVFLLLACELLDIVCMGLMIFNLDPQAYWTHSLVMAAAWSLAAAGVTALITRRLRPAIVLGSLVASHWVVDAITWPMTAVMPDTSVVGMPILFQETPRIGLGLYRSVAGVILGEGVFLAAGIALYVVWLVNHKRQKKATA